jgi:hypothetical protein
MPAKKPTPAPAPPKPPAHRFAVDPVPPPLELKARTRLRELLNDPVLARALQIVHLHKPGVVIGGATGTTITVSPEAALHAVNNRLHEIKGWEAYQTALFALVLDPPVKRAPLTETYPDNAL